MQADSDIFVGFAKKVGFSPRKLKEKHIKVYRLMHKYPKLRRAKGVSFTTWAKWAPRVGKFLDDDMEVGDLYRKGK